MKAYILDGMWKPKDEYMVSPREFTDHRAVRSDMVYKDMTAGIVDVPTPIVGENDVLIKVGACGICGSDMHASSVAQDGYTIYAGHLRLPIIMGHEFSGMVVETGKGVKKFKIDDIVAVEQIRPCGYCHACRSGHFNSCQNIEEVGLSIDGAFSEYAVVPEQFCCNINNIAEILGDKIATFEAGALAEPIGVAYNGMMVKGNGIVPGTHVAVFGAGPVGLAAISLARAAGAACVFAVDIREERLTLAKACGADYLLNPIVLEKEGASLSEIILDYTKQIGCRTVVEAAGSPVKTYPEIVKLMSIGANVVQIGRSPKLALVDLEQFIVKECSISGSIGTAGDDIIPSVLRMMATGRLDMRKIITGRFNLSDTQDGIDAAKQGIHGKVMISQFYD